MPEAIERKTVSDLLSSLQKKPHLIQVIIGPRQVGKTTAAKMAAERWPGRVVYASADLPLPPGPEWIENQWQIAKRESSERPVLLILDEVHKVKGFGETIKRLWDEQAFSSQLAVFPVLLGSSSLLLSRETNESLAGRFFLHRCLHWSYAECRRAFGWDLEHWLFFGGYPAAAMMAEDEERWRSYILDSLIEAILSRDVLSLQNINKPALLRHLFLLSASVPAQILSYNKMLGQLTDAGNTTTLAHYLRLLEQAFLVAGLERFSTGRVRSRGSSPKLIVLNNALPNAVSRRSFKQALDDPAWWSRLVENAAGAHLINGLAGLPFEITYWRQRNDEIDFVVRSGTKLWAIEIKSGREGKARGMEAFRRIHSNSQPLIIGPGGLSLEDFFLADPRRLFEP